MRFLASIRARVAGLVVLAVAVSLTVVGVVVVTSFDRREHQTLDDRLNDRPAAQVVAVLRRTEQRERQQGSAVAPPPLLRDGDLFARLSRGGRVVLERGVPEGLPPASQPGLRTETVGGEDYRVRVRRRPNGSLVEVGSKLSATETRIAALRNRVLVLSAAAVAGAGLLAWWVAGLALAPLGALREGAARVSSTRDLSVRLPEGRAGDEIDAVSGSLNEMLARLEGSAAETEEALAATRQFAADAGHEVRTPLTALRANLAALARNPDIPEEERRAILVEAEEEAARAARLLESLQLLARGEAGASLPTVAVDVTQLVDLAVERAARRHPRTRFELAGAPVEVTVWGWPDGLTSMVDNLLDNAARHGREDGRVAVALEPDDVGTRLVVDDDGPGIPPGDRDRLFDRFARGDTAAQGSGLGLALVRQQARLHGGEAEIADRPGGGTRMVVTLAAQATRAETTAS